MKKLLVGLFVLVGAFYLYAQPKVAVLDTLIDGRMDSSVIIPVTEKVLERFVVSGQYKVLDRSNIQQILREQEFQMSGMVSDAEITQAGRFLGADFVVVPRVQLIADTYFLTCKMINVETGVIVNQASTEGEGKLSVLLGMAERVGSQMAAGVNGQAVAVQQAPAPSTANQPATATAPAPVKKPATPKADENRVGFRVYGGLGGGSHEVNYYDTNFTYNSGGVELYALASLWKSLVLSGGFSYLEATDEDNIAKSTLFGGAGLAIPLGILMPWATVNFGIPGLMLDDTFYGAEFSLDIGLDLRLSSFLIGLHYQGGYAAISDGAEDFLYMNSNSICLVAGFRF